MISLVAAILLSSAIPYLSQSRSLNLAVNYGYQPTQTLISDLRKGGYVIYIRHTATDMTQRDRDPNLSNCAGQRNLNLEGQNQAKAIGQVFNQANIPVSKVLASPYCRTLETAKLAFSRVEPSQALISIFYDRTQTPNLVSALAKLLQTIPPQSTNTILVGHGVNLEVALEVSLREGGIAIFKPGIAGDFDLIAQVQTLAEWQAKLAE